eukprot:6459131-Lingulodinium_polyedra.AAC.1
MLVVCLEVMKTHPTPHAFAPRLVAAIKHHMAAALATYGSGHVVWKHRVAFHVPDQMIRDK